MAKRTNRNTAPARTRGERSAASLYLFRYSKTQETAIRNALKQAGFQHPAEWPTYRKQITKIARLALIRDHFPPFPSAPTAASQLRKLSGALIEASHGYTALIPEIRGLVDLHLDGALLQAPLLQNSIPMPDRRVLTKLLSSGRFQLALRIVAGAVDLVHDQLKGAGKKPIDLPGLVRPNSLPRAVRKKIQQADQQPRRPFGGLIQASGPLKKKNLQEFILNLCLIYRQATDWDPYLSRPTELSKTKGKFYPFVVAAIHPVADEAPTGLAKEPYLDHSIRVAIESYSDILDILGLEKHPPRKVKC